jgi:hypothetical protein
VAGLGMLYVRLLHIALRSTLHPHVHTVVSRGVWSADGSFQAIPALNTQQLMLLFRHPVVKNLLARGRIGQALSISRLFRLRRRGQVCRRRRRPAISRIRVLSRCLGLFIELR